MNLNFENVFLLIFAAIAVASAILMITRRNPVISVLYLILNFFSISVIFLFLKAQFVAIIQILIYAGAIMVLFLFVIMLLNLKDEVKLTEKITYKKLTAILLSILLFSLLSITTYFAFKGKFDQPSPSAEQIGTVESIGKELYTTFSFPFELVSLILLAAIIGAIVLAKKKFE